MNGPSKKYDNKSFIADSGDTSHMVTNEESMKNLWYAETIVEHLPGKNVVIGTATINIKENLVTWHYLTRV